MTSYPCNKYEQITPSYLLSVKYETVQHLLAGAIGGSLKEREKVPLTFFPMKLLNIFLIENLAPGKRQVEPSRQ